VNGTGIILHTALGRAPLAEAAQEALATAVKNYCTIAIDLGTGKRGDRHAHVAGLLQKLTGADAALVVNNNAAATLLILNTLAEGREVVISRGELVEIGGSFRIPDVMARSGAVLVEVGTTNRTHLRDYRNGLTDRTAVILKVHQSNYRIEGFTSQVPIEELAALGRERNMLVVDDVGSGALVDLSRYGLPREPLVRDSIAAGADAVCFSGDKLIGGPQCGIIVGKKAVIDRLKTNQLMRALRCDKLTYAVLEATLRLFLDEEWLRRHHPVVSMLAMSEGEIRKRCGRLRRALTQVLAPGDEVRVEKDTSEVGSGSLAAIPLPTWVAALNLQGMPAELLAARLRAAEVPVIGRVKEGRFLLDGRTIRNDEIPLVVAAMKQVKR
jgi:L-seryl-tRNA(Ser) seleniumtransferase